MLATAHKLAGGGAGPGRPAKCDLRRATSSAYYALFHQITRHAALSVVDADEEDIARMSRWVTHGGLRKAADWVVLSTQSGQVRKEHREAVRLLRTSSGSPPPRQLVDVAEAFGSLQEARHDADYNHDYDAVRYVTLEHVETADAAVRDTWSMWRAQWSTKISRIALHDSYRRFLQLGLLASGGPRAR